MRLRGCDATRLRGCAGARDCWVTCLLGYAVMELWGYGTMGALQGHTAKGITGAGNMAAGVGVYIIGAFSRGALYRGMRL